MNDIICDVENAVYVIEPETTELNVTPSKQTQVFNATDKLYNKVIINKVTNEIDNNIQSQNIKKDVSILGIEGNVIELNGETKEVTPTKSEQIVLPDEDKNALISVTVKPIPDDYIIPTGEIELTENKNYDVTSKSIAKVNVKSNIGIKNITENGVYNASDDNLDGYNQVNVQTAGIDEYFSDTISEGTYAKPGWVNTFKKFRSPLKIEGTSAEEMFRGYPLSVIPQIDTKDIVNMTRMFAECKYITTIDQLDTSNVTTMSNMFYNCGALETIPQLDTSNVTNIGSIFQACSSLNTIPQLNANKIQIVGRYTFQSCRQLKNLGGFLNLGQAYSTTTSANDYDYMLNLSYTGVLTHESLMNVINGLYDIKTKGCNAQSLQLGSTNLAKLTSEEIAIATDKGWTVS